VLGGNGVCIQSLLRELLLEELSNFRNVILGVEVISTLDPEEPMSEDHFYDSK